MKQRVYLARNEDALSRSTVSRRYIPTAMLLTAVARTLLNDVSNVILDGKIETWAFAEEVPTPTSFKKGQQEPSN